MKLKKSSKEKEVYSYIDSKGNKLWMYRHKFYDGITGTRKEKKKSGFKTEKAAIKALIEIKALTLRGETVSIQNDNLTVGQWLDVWFEANSKQWKPNTIVQRESFIRLQIKPLIGHIKLSKLDRYNYQKLFLNPLEGKYKPSTIRSFHVIVRTAINAAVKDEILLRNKLSGSIIPSKNAGVKENNYLDPHELKQLLTIVDGNEDITYQTLIYLLAYTGARKGEILALQWNDIDFKNFSISINKHRGSNGLGTTKTKNSERTIKVEKNIIQKLEQYKKALKPTLFKFGMKIEPTSFIFLSLTSGKPLPPTGINARFNKIIELAKVKKITIHGLRHTHATILLNNGIPVKAIAERLGNTPEMIHTVYGHVLKELEDKTVNVFSDSLNSIGAKNGASN